jgi:two-component system LytT family response regulator
MIRVVIIDDEKQARNALADELMGLNIPGIHLVGQAAFVSEAVHLINEEKPDLAFVDIQLGDGTGFQIVEGAQYRDFSLVFVTAYNEYAVKAFRANAMDYLLKPVQASELKEAVLRAVEQKALRDAADRFKPLNTPLTRHRVTFQTTEGISLHFTDEVIHCQASGNYTQLFFTSQSKLLIARTLKDVEEQLINEGFERVHQSHLVNLLHLRKYVSRDGGVLIMSDGTEIPVAQRKRARLLELLQQGNGHAH